MLGSATRSFADVVMTGEMIENAIRNGRIDAGESSKRSAPQKKENEVNNANMGYSKSVTVSQPKAITAGIVGHSIENCTTFKKLVERFIQMGIVKFDNAPSAENLLPNHTNSGVNVIDRSMRKRIKMDITEVRTPLKWVWKEMVKNELVMMNSEESGDEIEIYCEYHYEEGHEIQECEEFRAIIQGLMDNKEVEFYEEVKEEEYICMSKSTSSVTKVNYPVVIISRPKNEAGIQMRLKIIIQKPAVFSYKDKKRVPWNCDCSHTHSRRRYDLTNARTEFVKGKDVTVEQKKGKTVEYGVPVNEPVKEEEAKEFIIFLKHSEYSVVEQLHKQPTHISILALLLSSEVHRSALMKVLNETYVSNDISVNKLDWMVNNISTNNFIFFNNDEIPPGGMGSTKALHITTRCKGYTLLGVLVDNGSALNVLPLSTLNRLPVDSSHMKGCQNIMRVFDGTERRVMGRIEIPLLIGPTTYEVDFFVMDIKPSGVVPSSLHQKLKLVSEERLVTINAEEDIIVSSDASYLETDNEAIECSFRSLKFVNTTFITEGSRILEPKMSKITMMGLQLMVGRGALPRKGLRRCLQERIEVPMLKDKHDRFGLGFKPDARQRKKGIGKNVGKKKSTWRTEKESREEVCGSVYINAIFEETIKKGISSDIRPYEPGNVLDNWTAEDLPVVSRAYSE
ncbi:uncharacterized protein LOC108477528 [Gossypium arboreum]|uniref:uncharacterized protein LOC108477528 n=1 Tax=Gossypium arboreum TaxID=29729 RepID=UPI000819571F|nr:uncharacterized protein LOC108477528 [Gossypium arboreum]